MNKSTEMQVINPVVTFIPITKYNKLQLLAAKLFRINPAYRYTMEARLKLGPTDKLGIKQDVLDNFGVSWYVTARHTANNEYMLVSGETIHECDGNYLLTTLKSF